MAIKKSDLYSSLWASCDELRGGMDASLYKDYVLVLLFIKYISDKYADEPFAPIIVPKGASFKDMVLFKGNPDIGDLINKQIIGRIVEENQLKGTIDVADFNNDEKLGSGKEKSDKLTKLIAIFENPNLDFSKNKAEGDDILGDAYEYLMRNFATESGKSKGQFYTPAEVSRVLAKILGINDQNTNAETTVYDPTCGSGSLLLKVGAETQANISIYGQEMDMATAALARMNMVLHNHASDIQSIKQGNTIANPLFLEDGQLKRFDYVVANPPFSNKNWSNGIEPDKDERFTDFGAPPEKNGDYAFLLHIVKSLKSHGKGAVILPHGVLFRGNAEAIIRKNLIEKGYIKGIIGLPANLFYGTGIPACIILIDKNTIDKGQLSIDNSPLSIEKGIFMVDASKGFLKDGNKNRLREQDIHKIVDAFTNQIEIPKYSRFVPLEEISDAKNDYNLNIPRYIDSQESEDVQDIAAHLKGGIPNHDIAEMSEYWTVFPSLKNSLFHSENGSQYAALKVKPSETKQFIFQNYEFTAFNQSMNLVFETWKNKTTKTLKSLEIGCRPKEVIKEIAENILQQYADKPLIDKYDIYQHLMNYWNEPMQDDMYLIASDGWKATIARIIETNKKTGKTTDKGWACDLVPSELVVNRYFLTEKKEIEALDLQRETLVAELQELEEEHNGEDGFFAEMDKINKANVNVQLKIENVQLKKTNKNSEEYTLLQAKINIFEQYLKLSEQISKFAIQAASAALELDKKVQAQYPTLSESDIKQLVVDDKWMASIEQSVQSEMERVSQRLTQRIAALAERYATPLPQLEQEIIDLEAKVKKHLEAMGF